MASKGYATTKRSTTRYEFISVGPKGQITKRIEFIPLQKRGYYNVGFGDLMDDGSVNDIIYSNNQDVIKVMATVIDTMKDFLKEHSKAKLIFTGSTEDRTDFYVRILKRYYQSLSARYTITALIEDKNYNPEEIEFDPDEENKYLAFLVRNKM